jgi:hypothetical protein
MPDCFLISDTMDIQTPQDCRIGGWSNVYMNRRMASRVFHWSLGRSFDIAGVIGVWEDAFLFGRMDNCIRCFETLSLCAW